MATNRHVLECTWSGYTSSQARVCRRQVLTRKASVEAFAKLRTIEFTDNTTLNIRIRPALHREKISEKRMYDSLLREALATGKSYVRVKDLSN